MRTELVYLACTAMLTAALWIPYIVGQVMTNGRLKPRNYVDPAPRPVPLWAVRANRVHLNAVKSLAPFAALVIVAQLAGKLNDTTAFLAAAFFWLRATHAVVYWLGVPYIRTVVFTLGFFCVAGLFWQVGQVSRWTARRLGRPPSSATASAKSATSSSARVPLARRCATSASAR